MASARISPLRAVTRGWRERATRSESRPPYLQKNEARVQKNEARDPSVYRMRQLHFAVCASLALLPAAKGAGATPFFVSLGDLEPRAASADGSVVVGTLAGGGTSRAFRWTQAGGAQFLADASGTIAAAWATGVSGDGSVVVGNTVDGRAFRWTQAEGVADPGLDLGGGLVYGVSADGSVIVGYACSSTACEPFRWTDAGGMESLGLLPGNLGGSAWATSADGSVVVGGSGGGAVASQAFRWTQQDGMVGLGLLGGAGQTIAFGTSADGSVVVGGSPAFRWTQSDGMVALPLLSNGLPPGNGSASAVSGDGSIVVGGRDNEPTTVFVWEVADGSRRVTHPDWTIGTVSGISADGTTLFGLGTDPTGKRFQGWVASLDALVLVPEPGTCLLVAMGLAALAAQQRDRRRALEGRPS